MKFASILVMLLLGGCTLRDHDAEKRELNRLAECVCSTKGGYSYIRYGRNTFAKVVCHDGDTMYDLMVGDICKEKKKNE